MRQDERKDVCRGVHLEGWPEQSLEMFILDCFLITEDWEKQFSGTVQFTLPRPVLNHFLIMLDGGVVKREHFLFCLRTCG